MDIVEERLGNVQIVFDDTVALVSSTLDGVAALLDDQGAPPSL